MWPAGHMVGHNKKCAFTGILDFAVAATCQIMSSVERFRLYYFPWSHCSVLQPPPSPNVFVQKIQGHIVSNVTHSKHFPHSWWCGKHWGYLHWPAVLPGFLTIARKSGLLWKFYLSDTHTRVPTWDFLHQVLWHMQVWKSWNFYEVNLEILIWDVDLETSTLGHGLSSPGVVAHASIKSWNFYDVNLEMSIWDVDLQTSTLGHGSFDTWFSALTF